MTEPTMTIFDAAMIVDSEWELTSFEATLDNYIAAYQLLIDTGTAWILPGRIGRNAASMIEEGLCHAG